jgi:hypothetical protein
MNEACPDCDSLDTELTGTQDYTSQDGDFAESVTIHKCTECGVLFTVTFTSERKVRVI